MDNACRWIVFILVASPIGCSGAVDGEAPEIGTVEPALSVTDSLGAAKASLGEKLFNDEGLSASGKEACASCHVRDFAFTGNANPSDPSFPVSTGAFPNLLGVRNTPTAMYRKFSPPFAFVLDDGEYGPVGGQFLDGRADTLADQAKLPFLNPREMAMPSKAAVVSMIRSAPYADLFRRVYGRNVFKDTDAAYDDAADAIQAFEETKRFAPFSSKFDAVLRGRARFTAQEQRGFVLFKSPTKGNCIACHVGVEDSHDPEDWLFTDNTYDNLGVPRNPLIPDNADPTYFDLGVCRQAGIVDRVPPEAGDAEALVESICGAFKVPTLRNVAITAPYMHNGKFTSLRDVVSFCVTRDTNPERWYTRRADGTIAKFDDLPPEYQGNVNTTEVPYDRKPGDQPHLNPTEIDDVVAFLGTLTDGYGSR